MPTLDHLIKKIFLVSDNNAHNRLYEFCGQQYLNEVLYGKGISPLKIVHRIGITGFDTLTNQYCNPVHILHDDKLVHTQPETFTRFNWEHQNMTVNDLIRGKGYWNGEEVVQQPFDFTYKNFVPLTTQQKILESIIFPELRSKEQQWQFTAEDYNMIYRYMSMLPGESDYPAYDSTYYDSYVKFWMFGDRTEPIPESVRIFNKVGVAYGFLTDVAYIVDFENNIEFMLTGCLEVNDNEIYNDGEYEYDEIGIPFLAEFGRQVHQFEIDRPRLGKADLRKFKKAVEW